MGPSNYPLAGSTALAKASGWDSRVALDACVRAGLPRCQLFLNQALGADRATQDDLVTQASDQGLTLTCHAPVNLDETVFEPWMFEGFSRLLSGQVEKIVIIHADDRVPQPRALGAVRRLSDAGFVVAVENWYPDPAPDRAPAASGFWLDILESATRDGLAAWPVFDFPRIFHRALGEPDGGLALSLALLERIAGLRTPLVLHLIDCLDADQEEARWCALGRGCVPYLELLRKVEALNLTVHHAVFEFTRESDLVPSKNYLKHF